MKYKLKSSLMIEIILLWIAFHGIKSDEICDAIIIDAITRLENGTIVMFRNSEVWLLNRDKELSGPCPVNSVFNQMKGPVDAALTINSHETIVEFIGSSIYFENGFYYTLKNLLPYEVEWGSIKYLPHKGIQSKMGSTVPEAQKLMKTKISAAYFDPIDNRTKLVFSDASVLGFNFEFGSEFDTPLVSNLKSEFKKFGIDKPLDNIKAALTLSNGNKHELYLFDGNKYCSFKMDPIITNQNCEWKPNKHFLNCDQIVRKHGVCNQISTEEKPEKPIEAENDSTSDTAKKDKNKQVISRNVGPVSRSQKMDEKLSPRGSGHSFLFERILYILNFLVLFYHYFYK